MPEEKQRRNRQQRFRVKLGMTEYGKCHITFLPPLKGEGDREAVEGSGTDDSVL